jgi:LCP family protein required for cell wall assembly
VSDSSRSPRRARRPVARHGQLTSPHPLRQILTVFAVIIGVVITSTVGIGAYSALAIVQGVADNAVALPGDEELPPSIGEIEGGVNLLLVGTDSCEGQDLNLFPRCANDDAAGERNDVTMLVHISDNPRRVTVVSFPRDMIVPIPSCPSEDGGQYSAMSGQMLNASYTYGGLACTVLTIEALTGEDIQFAASIRWMGVIAMSDSIGGVDVCLTGEVNDNHTGLHLSAGTHTLQGWQALQFLRIRHGIGDGSDLSRISNQQQFMGSLVRKLTADETLGNPATLFTFASTAMAQVQTGQLLLSQSLANPTLMVQIAMAVKDVPYEDIVFVQYPTGYEDGGARVVPITSSADVLFQALRDNKSLTLTGDASEGGGTVVEGEASKPSTPTPTPTATPDPTDTATPTEDPAPPVDDSVALPDNITGSNASQVTCTQPQR